MIYAINYANDNYKKVQHLCTKTLYKYGKVDSVIEYGPDDIDLTFRNENSSILSKKKGNGYWLWKPYFVKKTLDSLKDGDYLLYVDSATVVIKNIKPSFLNGSFMISAPTQIFTGVFGRDAFSM